MDCSTQGLPVLHHLPELAQTMSIELLMPSNYLIFFHPLLLLPSVCPQIRGCSKDSGLPVWWPTYWRISFSISPSNEFERLISLRIHWFDLLAVQATLQSLLRHHSSKASILHCLVFFMVQLSHPHMTTWKTTALTIWTFVGKAMSLLFNMLPRLVIAFLPRSKCLLISWLQSTFAVILDPKKIKYVTVSTVSPSICHEVMGLDAMIFVLWMLSFKPAFSLSSFTLIKRPFSSSLLFAIKVVSSAYLRLLIFLPAILIAACASPSVAFHIVYSAYKLNKQGDNIQPWRTPFPIWNQSVAPCRILTVAFWPAYRFLRRQVKWSGIPNSWRIFQFVVIHTEEGFSVVSEAGIFLEFFCFFYDPMDVGNLISGSSAFPKSSLDIWKFLVHKLLKPSLENFEH